MRTLLAISVSLSAGLLLSGVQGCSSDQKAKSSGDAGGAATGGTAGTGGASGGANTGGAGTGGATLDAWSPEATGSACTTAADCYPGFDGGTLSGPIECIDKVTNGYCTHQCTVDSDCCKAPGECLTNLKQVCAPFENTGYKVCFLSCEAVDIASAQDASATLADGAPVTVDPNAFCQQEANPQFTCRSTGGGVANRQVCMPGLTTDGGPQPDGGRPSDGGPTRDGAPVTDAATDG